jgi:hypothetical protein
MDGDVAVGSLLAVLDLIAATTRPLMPMAIRMSPGLTTLRNHESGMTSPRKRRAVVWFIWTCLAK